MNVFIRDERWTVPINACVPINNECFHSVKDGTSIFHLMKIFLLLHE